MAEKTIVIIGAGPAGNTAAIYCARAGLNTILYEGDYAPWQPGGQLMTTSDLENFPGFQEAINGPVFCNNLREQSIKQGAKILFNSVCKIEKIEEKFRITDNSSVPVVADAVIVATGADALTLNVPGKEEYWQKGISACAVCDGALPIFRDQIMVVVGGGDSAMEEALWLTRYASQVIIVHRRDCFRASRVLQNRVFAHQKITVRWNSELTSVVGDGRVITGVYLSESQSEPVLVPCKGLFFAIGHKPNTEFLQGMCELDDAGYLLAERRQTTVTGMFAAGDVSDRIYRQAVTAAGSGCEAALEAIHYLDTQ